MIRFGEDKYKEALMEMWRRCFPQDTDNFIRFYFNEIYKKDEILLFLEDNRPVAALQMIPYSIKTGNNCCSAGYLSGVMTHPDYRNKGCMAQLLHAAFNEMTKKGYDYAFLIPQEKWLTEIYAKYGFKSLTRCTKREARNQTSPESDAILPFGAADRIPSSVYPVYSRFLQEKASVVLKTEKQFELILRDFWEEKGILFANEQGIAFTLKTPEKIILKEFFYRNETIQADFLKKIRAYYCLDTVEFPNETQGMIKQLNPFAEEITHLYLGMMLD